MEKKVIVIYYSRSGNSKLVAENITKELGCDIEEIKSQSDYAGILGYIRALMDVIFKNEPEVGLSKRLINKYDLVIVGGPMWGSSLSSPVRSFLNKYKQQFTQVAFFLTQGGSVGRNNYFSQAKESAGIDPVAFLTVTEGELKNKTYTNKIARFISELQLEKKSTDTDRSLQIASV